MSDYIKREDALKPEIELLPDVSGLKTNQHESFLVEQVIQIYKNYLKNLPAADVVERKRGKWIYQFHEDEVGVTCSECEGYAESFARWIYDEGYRIDYNFCPNCGAEMESADDV